jgi:hypothetical protein
MGDGGDMADYSDRFVASTYSDDEPVLFSVTAENRNDRFSVSMPESLFARAIKLGAAYNLHLLPTLEVYGETSLVKAQCATLLQEVRFVVEIVNDSLLRQHLSELISALERCAHAPGLSGMLIEGP